MPLPAVLVTVTAAERTALKKRIRGTRTAWRDRLRAQIVLAAAMGRSNARIARDLSISHGTMRHMAAIPESTRSSVALRLLDHADQHWPQLHRVQVTSRAGFAYVTGILPDGEQIPLCRLRYGGSAHSFGFAIYSAARARYQDAVLLSPDHRWAHPKKPSTPPAPSTSQASDTNPRQINEATHLSRGRPSAGRRTAEPSIPATIRSTPVLLGLVGSIGTGVHGAGGDAENAPQDIAGHSVIPGSRLATQHEQFGPDAGPGQHPCRLAPLYAAADGDGQSFGVLPRDDPSEHVARLGLRARAGVLRDGVHDLQVGVAPPSLCHGTAERRQRAR